MDFNSFNFCGEVLNKNNVGKLIEKRKKVLKSLYQFSFLFFPCSMFKRTDQFQISDHLVNRIPSNWPKNRLGWDCLLQSAFLIIFLTHELDK